MTTSHLLVNLAACAIAVAVLLGAVFALSVHKGRHDLIDTAWGLGFALVAIVTLILSAGHGSILVGLMTTVLTLIWGVRLAVHIGLRNRGRPEDRRYVEIRDRATGNPNLYLLRTVYLTQAGVLLLVSLPVQVAPYGDAAPPALLIAGALVWLLGFGFETIGDLQLTRFRADPANHGRVLDTGLWRYTRHPNYFGDACVWWGLYLLACHHWIGVATVISPILMTYLLARGTGKPLLEGHLRQHRPDYADYIARTSGFLPLPPRPSIQAPSSEVNPQ